MIDPNQHDRFVMRQRVKLVVNQYEFALPGDEWVPFCFVEQKRFKFKEDIRFYAGADRMAELLRIKARQRFDPAATYDVTTADGLKIGEIRKEFGTSLLRSTYHVSAGGISVVVQERSVAVALFRRLVRFIPFVENVADWLPIPYDFEFRLAEMLIGTHRRRRWKLRDVYDLDFSGDVERVFDRRMGLAMAVGLDALQAR